MDARGKLRHDRSEGPAETLMATKAELEAELAALRRELAALKGDVAEAAGDAAEDTEETAHGMRDTVTDFVASLKDTDLDGLAKQLTDEIETAMQDKPLLTALGILLVGYALGRLR
jgi:hypothetical protein